MSSLAAALLVIGLLVVFGVPALYWVFYKMDNHAPVDAPDVTPPRPMTAEQIHLIESKLSVTIPENVRLALSGGRPAHVDSTSLIDDPAQIIEATLLYRAGFSSLSPWPTHLVYIGDESDACPYVLDCSDGSISQLDKGNLARKPLQRFKSIDEFCANFV